MLIEAPNIEVVKGTSLRLPPLEMTDNILEAKKLSDGIISRLDSKSIIELSGGTESDVLNLFDNIYNECLQLYANRGVRDKIDVSALEYLDALADNIDQEFKYEDINYFVSTVFPTFDIDWHILEWGHFVMKFRNLCILAARGRGKSFYFSRVLPIWKMYRYQRDELHLPRISKSRRDCEKGLILTASADLGASFFREMKDVIMEHPVLADRMYPDKGEGFKEMSIRTKNGAYIETKGFDSNIRGKHPHYMICDDLLSENQLYSADARNKAIEKFKGTALKLPIEGGQTVIVGTPFHEDDLYATIGKKMSGWILLKYPALYPNGEMLAPNRFSFRSLLEDRHNMSPTLFSRELLCMPVSGASTIFPFEIVKNAIEGMEDESLVANIGSANKKYRFKKIVMGCDLALSANTEADYSVFITIGLTDNDERVLLNIWREKGKTLAEQKAKIKALYDEFEHDLILIESNQFQAIVPQQLKEDYPNMPVEGYQTTVRKNLLSGIPSLTILFEKYKYKFPYGDEKSKDIVDTLFSELSSMAYTNNGLKGVGSHDDMVMALWFTEVAILKDVSFSFGYI